MSGDQPTPPPTPDEIAAACAEIQGEWDAETERLRRYDPPHANLYHLVALVMGADERRAWKLFRGERYRSDGRVEVRRMTRPRR